jgi:hypothetical protein
MRPTDSGRGPGTTGVGSRCAHFLVEADVTLTEDEIWPDGDAPPNWTQQDVEALIKKCGGALRVIRDWELDDYLELKVYVDD